METKAVSGDFITDFGKVAVAYSNSKNVLNVTKSLTFFDKVNRFNGYNGLNYEAGFLLGLNTSQTYSPDMLGLDIWDMVNGKCKLRESDIVMFGGEEKASAYTQISNLNLPKCKMTGDINIAYRLDEGKCVGTINKLVFMGVRQGLSDSLTSYLNHLTSAVAYRIEKKSSVYSSTLTLGPKDKTGRYLYYGDTVYKYDGADLVHMHNFNYAIGKFVIQDKYCFDWNGGSLSIYSMETGKVVATKTINVPTSQLDPPISYTSVGLSNMMYDCNTGTVKVFCYATDYRSYNKADCVFEVSSANTETITPTITAEGTSEQVIGETGCSGDIMKIGDRYYFTVKSISGYGQTMGGGALATSKNFDLSRGLNFNSIEMIGGATYSNARFDSLDLINIGGVGTIFSFGTGYIQTTRVGKEIGNIFSVATPSEPIVKKATDIIDIEYTYTM